MTVTDPPFGRIATRRCPACGHHEVGYVTESGAFHPLKAGDVIQLVQTVKETDSAESVKEDSPETRPGQEPVFSERTAWVPEALRGDRGLRLKFGVAVHPRLIQNGMTGAVYELAFRQKLQDLIEKEVAVPLPVLLDRFFNTPHLAAGTAKDVADALFEALDEISEPFRKMRDWLDNPGREALAAMVQPGRPESLPPSTISDAALRQELEALTLEEFFELL